MLIGTILLVTIIGRILLPMVMVMLTLMVIPPTTPMLHACSYTICLVFCYTSWHFYVFSRTNLLTRCHSASSLYSAVFVFQKSYTRNILGIGWNKSWTSYYLPKLPEVRREDREGPRADHTIGRHGQPLAHASYGWGHTLVHLWCCPFAYKDHQMGKT
jgi:hypothetical protein